MPGIQAIWWGASMRIYTDGACSGNPGPGGWGVLALENGRVIWEISGSEAMTTNNKMELMAAIAGLERLPDQSIVTVFTDSQYVRLGMTTWVKNWQANGWRTASGSAVKNKDLWQRLIYHAQRCSIDWQWVKGHSGDAYNDRADALAREAIGS